MKERSLCISIKLEGSLDQKETVLYFTKLFQEQYNKIFSELYYTITDKTKPNWKQKTNGGKYTINSFNKFKDTLNKTNDKIFVSFEMLTNLKDYEIKSRDIDFSISYNPQDEINSLNFIFNSIWISQLDINHFIREITNLLVNQKCKIVYGFVIVIENTKMPSLYIEGISNGKINKEEEEKLFLWLNNLNQCKNKIWDIFWGNIISEKHINNNTFNDLESIVGKENIDSLTSNLICFKLPEPLNKFELSKYSIQRKKLYDYFKTQDLILY